MSTLQQIDMSYFICKYIDGLVENLQENNFEYTFNQEFVVVLNTTRLKKMLPTFAVEQALLVNLEYDYYQLKPFPAWSEEIFYDFKSNIELETDFDKGMALLGYQGKEPAFTYLKLEPYAFIEGFRLIAKKQLEGDFDY